MMKHINRNGDVYFPVLGTIFMLGILLLALFLSACNNKPDIDSFNESITGVSSKHKQGCHLLKEGSKIWVCEVK